MFSSCFNISKERKEEIAEIQKKIPDVYQSITELKKGKSTNFPPVIECMSLKEIRDGEAVGAGHGMFEPQENLIKINKTMSSEGIFLNFIHENLHSALPQLNEKSIDIMTHWVGCETGVNNDDICDWMKSAR